MFHVKHFRKVVAMANYTDIVSKYMTWYKGVTAEVKMFNRSTYLILRDTKTGATYKPYTVDELIKTFKTIGTTREAIGA